MTRIPKGGGLGAFGPEATLSLVDSDLVFNKPPKPQLLAGKRFAALLKPTFCEQLIREGLHSPAKPIGRTQLLNLNISSSFGKKIEKQMFDAIAFGLGELVQIFRIPRDRVELLMMDENVFGGFAGFLPSMSKALGSMVMCLNEDYLLNLADNWLHQQPVGARWRQPLVTQIPKVGSFGVFGVPAQGPHGFDAEAAAWEASHLRRHPPPLPSLLEDKPLVALLEPAFCERLVREGLRSPAKPYGTTRLLALEIPTYFGEETTQQMTAAGALSLGELGQIFRVPRGRIQLEMIEEGSFRGLADFVPSVSEELGSMVIRLNEEYLLCLADAWELQPEACTILLRRSLAHEATHGFTWVHEPSISDQSQVANDLLSTEPSAYRNDPGERICRTFGDAFALAHVTDGQRRTELMAEATALGQGIARNFQVHDALEAMHRDLFSP